MFFPYINGKIVLKISHEDFFFFLEQFVENMPKKEPLKFIRKNKHTAVILSNKISLFRRYNISRGEFRVFECKNSKGEIEINYKISYTKWFLSLVLSSTLFLVAMAGFYFFYSKGGTREIHIFQNMYLMFSVLFWVVLWPVSMNIFYGLTLRRLFETLFISFQWKKK
jgi:hypothetical protein